MWKLFSVQSPDDQLTLFEGFEMPLELSETIDRALADLPVSDKLEYGFQWIRIRPFAYKQRLLPRDNLVKEILSLVHDDMTFAQEDEEMAYKLCAFAHPNSYNILSSFRHKNAPVDWGWLQREYTVIRKGHNMYSLFVPKP